MPGATNLKDCGILESLVKKQAVDGRLYAAVCASPAVALGSWGLLKGLKVSFNRPCFTFYILLGVAFHIYSRADLIIDVD